MDLLFRVVEVAPSGERIIATADNLAVARAVALWPNLEIELAEGAGDFEQSDVDVAAPLWYRPGASCSRLKEHAVGTGVKVHKPAC
jgi:hypothetical protein